MTKSLSLILSFKVLQILTLPKCLYFTKAPCFLRFYTCFSCQCLFLKYSYLPCPPGKLLLSFKTLHKYLGPGIFALSTRLVLGNWIIEYSICNGVVKCSLLVAYQFQKMLYSSRGRKIWLKSKSIPFCHQAHRLLGFMSNTNNMTAMTYVHVHIYIYICK